MSDQWDNLLLTMNGMFQQGEQIYQALLRISGEKKGILVCPEHIGDTVLIASLAKEYKSCNHLDFLIMVSYTVPPEVLQFFPGVDSALQLEKQGMKALEFYMLVSGKYCENGIRYAFHRRWAELHVSGIVYNFFSDPEKTLIDTMRGMLSLGSDHRMHRMDRLPAPSKEEVEQYRNAVLLMPGTYTEQALPVSFWEELADRLLKAGYEVYNNYNGHDCEMLIEGAIPLSTSLAGVSRLAGCFHGFVGIRSGICDLLTFAGAKKLLMIYHGENGSYHIETMEGDLYQNWMGNVRDNPNLYIVERKEKLLEAIMEEDFGFGSRL